MKQTTANTAPINQGLHTFRGALQRLSLTLLLMLLTTASAWALKAETTSYVISFTNGQFKIINVGSSETYSWDATISGTNAYWKANDGHEISNDVSITPNQNVFYSNVTSVGIHTTSETKFTFEAPSSIAITNVTFKNGSSVVKGTNSESGSTYTVTLPSGSSFDGFEVTYGTISGECGDNANWTLSKQDGQYTKLTISGSGAMNTYGNDGASIWHTNAPWGYDLTSVTIGNNVTSIGTQAFIGCQSLSSLTIGSSVTTIGTNAFDHCDELTEVTLPASVTTINDAAFKNCGKLQRVNIQHDGAVSLGSNVFQNCGKLQYIVFPNPAAALANTTGNWSGLASKLRVALGSQLFTATNQGSTAAYAITSETDLRNLASAINDGNEGIVNGKTFRQTGDITLSSTNFDPIGYNSYHYFTGTYDGGDYTISDLNVGDLNYHLNYGLFGYVKNGTVKNVRLVSPTVNGEGTSLGALIGKTNNATVKNCVVFSPTIWGNVDNKGAIIGSNSSSTLENLYYYDGNLNNAIGGGASGTNVGRVRKVILGSGIASVSPAINPTATSLDNGFVYKDYLYYREGLELTLTTSLNIPAGYHVVYKGDGNNITSPYTVSSSDVTLTAQKVANTYTVKFFPCDGSGSMDKQAFTYDEAQNLTVNAFTRTGYTFAGWATSENGNVVYDDKQSVKNLTTTNGGMVNLYAKWTADQYTVTLNNQNATTAGTASVTATYDAAMPAITVPTRTGYTFGGYYTETNGGGTQYYKADGTSANNWNLTAATMLYAQWTANTYTVTFEIEGGNGGSESATATYDAAMPAITVPTRTGYTFGGYYTEANGGGTQYYYADGTSANNWNIAEATPLYAQWTANTYTVTFDNQSATTAGSESATATYDAAMPAITVPTKTGYTFGGYYTETNGGGTQYYKADGTSANNWNLTAATMLYAQWTANTYTVTFEIEGGNGGSESATATYDAAMPAITVPTKTGYTFGGYYTETNGGGTQYYKADGTSANNWNLTAATMLYAQWTANTYTVTFEIEGGNGGSESATATYDAAMPAITVPTRTGYIFGGYYTEENGGGTQYYNADGTSANNWIIAEATTLYAQWTANTYTVAFNANGGSGSMSDQTFTYDEAQNLTGNAFTRTGCIFAGWATSANGDVVYSDQQSVSNLTTENNGTVTLYAKWVVPYIDADGNTQYCSNFTVLTNSTNISNLSAGWYVVTENVSYTRQFYCFEGDIHLILCDGAKIAVEANSSAIQMTDGNLTIYAQSTGSSMGRLEATTSNNFGIQAAGSITICGGNITATGIAEGIYAGDNITIHSGQVNASGYHGIRSLNGNITLGLRNTTDYITASSYKGTVNIADGQTLIDGTAAYTGNNVSIPSGKTLALPVPITLGDDITGITGIVEIGGNKYAKAGATVTVSVTAPKGYAFSGNITVSPTVDVTDNGNGTYSFTMPEETVTVTHDAKWDVPYIDADGNTQYCSNFTVLTNSTNISNLSAGWYVVTENVSYTRQFYCFEGDIHLILCDGAKIAVEANSSAIQMANGNLTIYAQSTGSSMGKLIATSTNESAIYVVGSVTICGGNITATDTYALNNFTIHSGQISVSGVNGIQASKGTTLGLRNVTDYITVSKYYGTVNIAQGQTLIDGTAAYTGNNVSIPRGKTLALPVPITLADDITGITGIVEIGGNKYAKAGATVSVSVAREGYTFSGDITVSPTVDVIDNGNGTYSFTMPEETVTVTHDAQWTLATYTITYHLNGGTLETDKNSYTMESDDITLDEPTRKGYIFFGWYTKSDLTGTPVTSIDHGSTGDKQFYAKWVVPYIDADGNTQYCSNFTVLTNSTNISNLSAGWYVVTENVSYTRQFYCFEGDIHLILCDGAKIAVEANSSAIQMTDGNLTIYAQSTGSSMGRLEATTSNNFGIRAAGSITICGGNITATGIAQGIYAGDNITIHSGQITATGNYYGIQAGDNITIHSGQITATGNNFGIDANYYITIGLRNATDYITASSYNKKVNIAQGQTLTDENNTPYSGNNVSIPGGKTLKLVPTLELSDNADNAEAIGEAAAASTGGSLYNVILSGRKLYKDGAWNTLCLPFDVTIKGSVLDGDDVKAMVLDDKTSGLNGDELTLNFVDAPATIPAGTPFIIKWKQAAILENPAFTGVTIDDTDRPVTSKDDNVSFKGTYAPINWTVETPSILFLGDANTLYYPKAGAHLNAFRAYFELADGEQARSFNLNFGEETTGVVSMHNSECLMLNKADAWYTVNGVKLDGKPTAKGMYIHGGRKVVIK